MSDYKPEAWRIAGYYPGQYAKSMAALGIGIDYSDDDHDRYEAEFLADLAEHDAAVKAAAWDEGQQAGVNNQCNWDGWRHSPPEITNPYRNPRTPGEETT